MISSPAADAATAPVHTDGPDCPACSTRADWLVYHCYDCGKPNDPVTAELFRQADCGTPAERDAANVQLSARPADPGHEGCFQ